MIDRITILGGSSVYIPEFVLSLISHNVNVKEIVLFGRDGEKLPIVAAFCQRLIDRSGYPTKVVPITKLHEAVTGAKYVLNHVRVGGMRARLRDEKLPPRLGMIGDETLGAGGFANAMRTLPVVLEHAAVIEQTNPDCTFINLTNPMGIVVEALLRHTKLNVVGVCDLPGVYIKKIAEVLKKDVADLEFDYIGLNHMGWIQNVVYEKQSCMATLIEKIEKHHNDGFDVELVTLFRMIPTRYAGFFFHAEEVLKHQKNSTRVRAEILFEAEQRILDIYRDEHVSEIPEITRERNAIWYEETILPLIQALENPRKVELILCVRNGGAIRDLPDDCSVEIPVQASRRGIKPHMVGACPHFLKGLFQAVKQSDRLTVEAARHKSYEYALQALAIHPLVPSIDAARRFLDRLIQDENLELH